MTKRLLSSLIASVFLAASAFGEDTNWNVEGGATLGWFHDSINSSDQVKAEEYKDLSNGVLSDVFVRGRSGQTWFDGYGENFGRTDQYMMLRGGIYDVFKMQIYSDKIPHNFLANGFSPYSGTGSNNLTGTFPDPNFVTWNRINIGYERTDNGGYFEWQGLAPWYFRIDANQVRFDGTKIGSGALGTSPGNGFIDLAIPVQYNTTNTSGEIGYNTGAMNLSVNYLYSRFDNNYETLSWTNPFFGNNVDSTYLPPDNHFDRLIAQATFRELPWQSTLSARYTWSEMESTAALAQTALNGSPPNFYGPTDVNVNNFNGKIDNNLFTLALASHPAATVDTRIYYNYYNRKNDSTQVIYGANSIVNCGGVCQSLQYAFTKNQVGFDAYWRFLPSNRLGVGYDYQSTTQNSLDYNNIDYNRFFVEWKNTALDNFTARVKYSYLQRRSDYLLGNAGVDANDPLFLERFTSRFDESNLNQNQLKLWADWSPLPMLDFDLEATWQDNQFKDITLGRTSNKREEVYLSAAWGDTEHFRLTAFGDYEHVSYGSNHRNIGSGTCLPAPPNAGNDCFDPSTPPNSIAYNWSEANSGNNWVIGVGADWPVMERFMVKGSLLYYETDGSANTVSQNNYGNPLPLNALDNSKHTSLNLKGIYQYDKNWSFTVGYAYERWRYSDASYNGYQYTIPYPGVTNNTSQSYLNGYLAFTNYNENIVYLLASYKFDTFK
ncbi:MAG TPA: MtrB/PioB family outer membrane beta-barrel protein [Casimicrobiaceae bacterium]|jgi:MtrB/PioB family decaheme-associated outer membrane protein|nr:MtrB/PioB family outer membrane beta-barrel protein [Casimicrobiaceae bacterium]